VEKRFQFKLLIILVFFASCARAPLKDRGLALERTHTPSISDDLEISPLIEGIRTHIKWVENDKSKLFDFTFGKEKYSNEEYLKGLKFLMREYKKNPTKEEFFKLVKKYFDFYRVYGYERKGEILLTSYYGPIIKGSRKKTEKYSQPLYSLPEDLVQINLREYLGEEFNVEMETPVTIYGRLIKGEGIPHKIVPYYSRSDLDVTWALDGKGLEICYVDPIDAFFLHIQGSGNVRFPDGKVLSVGYAGQNGRKYHPIGKELLDFIDLENMSLQNIEEHLKGLSREKAQEILNKNPSYVFFKILPGKPITTLGTEVIDGRTLATDLRFFPKGSLGFLMFEKPKFEGDEIDWEKAARFVIDQDSGGAIKGGGRADLYWGRGPVAKNHAGIMKNKAKLFYLAPKREFLGEM
jgi:membrane-bound lytic murein transglycosylase A